MEMIELSGLKSWMSRHLAAALAVAISASCVGCGGNIQPDVGYKPAFLPIQFDVSQSGITIGGDTSIVTPIGVFSIGAHYLLPATNSQSIYVIFRNRQAQFDHIYEVHSGTELLTAVLDGSTTISVSNDRVVVDVMSGKIEKITFKRTRQFYVQERSAGWLASRWDEGWKQSWYKPFTLTEWAYSDSTIEKWYGLGFIWFLLRLILAIVLLFVDAILTLGFLIGQAFFILFGPTGRDVVYGIMVLLVVAPTATALSERIGDLRRDRRRR
jgi:hypothetical protein